MDLRALERFAVPLARGHGGMGSGDLAGKRAQHEEGQFGRGDRVAGRGVHHHDAPLGGGGDINVVHAHARAPDDLEFRGRLQHRLGDLRLGADHDGLHVGQEGQQF